MKKLKNIFLPYKTGYNKPVLLVLCLLFSTITWAQVQLSGQIIDQQKVPIPGAIIEIHETGAKKISDINGQFTFPLKKGEYHVHVSSVGFHAYDFTVNALSDTSVGITLEEHINELHEVTIETSSFKKGEKEASLNHTVVTEEERLESGAATFTEGIEGVQGVRSINTGVGISKPVIRGFSGNRIIVNDNGIKQEGQQWGADHGLEISPYDPEQVEIIKGPGALMYGSDGLGGVINIKRPSFATENQYEGDAGLIYRSVNNTAGAFGKVKINRNNNLLRVSLSGQKYQDYKVPASQYTYKGFVFPIENGILKNTAGEDASLSLTAGISRDWGFSTVTISHFQQKVGIFPGGTGIPQSYSLNDDGNHWNIDLPNQETAHTKIISNNSFTLFNRWAELDAGYQYNHRQENSKPHNHGIFIDPSQTLSTDLKLQTASLNFRLHNKAESKWDVIYGLQTQTQVNQIGGYEFIIPAYTASQFGAYSLFSRSISEKSIVNFGLRLQGASLNSPKTERSFYQDQQIIGIVERSPEINRTFVNYAAGLGYSYLITDEWNLKLNAGKSFRTPNIAELASNGSHTAAFRFEKGNPNLNPEEGYQFDLALNQENQRFHTELNGFFNYFSNYIYLRPESRFAGETINDNFYPYPSGGQLYQYVESRALHYRGEYLLHYHLSKQITLGTTGELVIATNLDKNRPLPFIPPFSTSLFAEHSFQLKNKTVRKWTNRLTYTFTSAQNRVEINERTTPGYQLLKFVSVLSFGKQQEKAQLKFTVQNLSNQYYFNNLSRYRLANIPEPARNLVVTFRYFFSGKSA